jgi:hypothetical protein
MGIPRPNFEPSVLEAKDQLIAAAICNAKHLGQRLSAGLARNIQIKWKVTVTTPQKRVPSLAEAARLNILWLDRLAARAENLIQRRLESGSHACSRRKRLAQPA